MILVSKFQPNISQSLTLYWETQFAKIGVYLFMECEIIGKFENDVFELSPIKISMPLASTPLRPKWVRIVLSREIFSFTFFCLRLIIVCASCVVVFISNYSKYLCRAQVNKPKLLHQSA